MNLDASIMSALLSLGPYTVALIVAVIAGLLVAGVTAVLLVARSLQRVAGRLSRGLRGARRELASAGSIVAAPADPAAEVQAAQHSAREDQQVSTGDQALSPGRRRFLTVISLALGSLGAAIVGVPVIGALFSPVRRAEAEVWRPVGAVDDFPLGDTVQISILDPDPLPWAGPAAETPGWLRREAEQEFTVFSAYCTHVGCPVRWEPGADFFMCPCHGGVFHRDGTVAAGPPPRPLALYAVRVRGGQVEVRTRGVPLPSEEAGASKHSRHGRV